MLLHEVTDAKELFEATAKEQRENGLSLPDSFVEKDYWLMHCLWGLQQQGYQFALKGGTSLSKGFNIIERFSEDIDIQIFPTTAGVLHGKNHDKPKHIASRQQFFAKILHELNIPGLTFTHDPEFDDPTGKVRNIGIRGIYDSHFEGALDLKQGILLEIGFDQVTPNMNCNITSWAYEKTKNVDKGLIDNRALNVACYYPEYTFVEKLQTISTKYRQQQAEGTMPINFLRHYYDVYKLLENERVIKFIGSEEYVEHKNKRFRSADEKDMRKNNAFTMPDADARNIYSQEFKKKQTIYYGKQPEFTEILNRFSKVLDKL